MEVARRWGLYLARVESLPLLDERDEGGKQILVPIKKDTRRLGEQRNLHVGQL